MNFKEQPLMWIIFGFQGSLLPEGAGAAVGDNYPIPPFSYSDMAGAGLAKFLDDITPEEAASLVSCH